MNSVTVYLHDNDPGAQAVSFAITNLVSALQRLTNPADSNDAVVKCSLGLEALTEASNMNSTTARVLKQFIDYSSMPEEDLIMQAEWIREFQSKLEARYIVQRASGVDV